MQSKSFNLLFMRASVLTSLFCERPCREFVNITNKQQVPLFKFNNGDISREQRLQVEQGHVLYVLRKCLV